ncbi:uncharacterized protein si:ch1073-456m8.1 [Electrophorus electricus]|uniref:uncharacterized protein si:ch1073-456m8.1 n=1 Tax=Electrophorus electricus TaxID=8005 RepID=UPI0015D05470|nr:uncharacterized protein si:ch1073-456m8.1 [Electrophorus electricus]
MNSGTLEKTDSPKKRILSRGMSEEESLRHIIQEAEQTPKRLNRSDSRHGLRKRGEMRDSQSEEEHAVTNMMELQANYEDCLQELQTLELKQEVVLFQVDCLQDALLGAEEMLAETQREAHEIRMELERERERRRTLEDMVASLTQEVDWLKEEKKSALSNLLKIRAEVNNGDAVGPGGNPAVEIDGNAPERMPVCALSSDTSQQSPGTKDGPAGFSTGRVAYFLQNMKVDPSCSRYTGSIQPQGAPEGTSVDKEVCEPEQRSDVDHLDHVSQQAGLEGGDGQQAQDGDENDESSGYEDARSEFLAASSTPDELLDPNFLDHVRGFDECELKNSSEPRSPKSQDSCVLS